MTTNNTITIGYVDPQNTWEIFRALAYLHVARRTATSGGRDYLFTPGSL